MFLWKPVVSRMPRDSDAFAALVYEGVSKKPNEVSPALFREHLDALRLAGYVPIDLTDVRDLVCAGKPVPRRAVLLTFDHCRKSSYYSTRGPLRKAGWNAVMFLWTKSIEEEDPACVLWPYVRGMVRSGRWQVAAQSHEGVGKVPSTSDGDMGNFMTTLKWIAEEARFETEAEFCNRLAGDHDKCIDLIRRKAGANATAYAYPYGDFGQYHRRDETIRRVNMQMVGERYDLGFLSGSTAINTKYSDRRRLNRLYVRPEWSGKELVEYIEKCWPVENGEHDTRALTEFGWIVDWGNFRFDKGQLILEAKSSTTGARTWLAGSDFVRDFHFHAGINILSDNGHVAFYVRATPDEEMYVCLTIGADGGIWLRQKQAGLEAFTLGSTQTILVPGQQYPLDLIIRGSLMCVFFDGKQLFNGRIALRGRTKPGMLGISVWDAATGRASVKISNLKVASQISTVASWDLDANLEPYVVQWVHRNAFRISGISPPWMSVAANGQITRRDFRQSPLFGKIPDLYGLDVMPEVSLARDGSLPRISSESLAREVDEMRMAGICMNLSSISNPSFYRIANWLRKAAVRFREKGLSLCVRLPTALETRSRLSSMLSVIPAAQIVAPPGSRMYEVAKTQADVVALKKIPEPGPGENVPTYLQIADASTGVVPQTVEMQAVQLEREGLIAFRTNDYRSAIASWSRWMELEPSDPRPPMLVGDAYVRLNETARALKYYADSLDLDPGQVKLAIRHARLLESMDRADEAMELLNIYAKLFPEDERITFAQAEWLHGYGRDSEARVLAKEVMARSREDVRTLVFLLSVSRSQEERSEALDRFTLLAENPEMHHDIIEAIWKHQLLSVPDSHVFVALVEKLSRESMDDRVIDIAARLKPPVEPVEERLDGETLSDFWRVEGGSVVCEQGTLQMSVSPERREAYVQMLGSERLREVFIEATVKRLTGSFWLYARRSTDHFVRFGVDESTERIHLQVWRKGRIVNQTSEPWRMPERESRMRLEIRGDGAVGYLDDRKLFASPETIPGDLGLGWTGISVWSLDMGRAQVSLTSLSAGPLPLRLALLPPIPATVDTDEIISSLRPSVHAITGFCPRWFTVNRHGRLLSRPDKDDKLLRMFARYNRKLLLPVVEIPVGVRIRAADILKVVESGNGDGVVLKFETMPPQTWFDEIEKTLRMSAADIVAIEVAEKGNARIRCLGAARDLLPGRAGPQTIRTAPRSKIGISEKYLTAEPLILRF